jgi:hypothetical protein
MLARRSCKPILVEVLRAARHWGDKWKSSFTPGDVKGWSQ